MTLFSPYRLGSLDLPNRIVMAPMTRSRALGNLPNALMQSYYGARAEAGLIITEGVAPSANALGYARIPGLFTSEQVAAWRPVTDAVHARGGHIFAQLMHVGRIAHPHNLPPGARILAPSAVAAAGQMWTDQQGLQPLPTPQEMNASDLSATAREFAQAARNARSAGFDGVELHGANGYLLEQFLHPHTNRRTDAYGGSVAARIRFVIEVARATADAIGADRVGLRLSPHNTFNDLPPHADVEPTFAALASELRGLAYLHLVSNPNADWPATARAIRHEFRGTIIANGGFDRQRAEDALQARNGGGSPEAAEIAADLIAFGRPFIANPDLVERLRRGVELAAPNPATFYTASAEGYVDYPALA
jgi:N-ethylmaleimide reductase